MSLPKGADEVLLEGGKGPLWLHGDRVAWVELLIKKRLFEWAYVVVVAVALTHAQLGRRHGEKLVVFVEVDGLPCEVVFRVERAELRLH